MNDTAQGKSAVYAGRNTGYDRKMLDDTIENIDMELSLCAIDFADDTIRRLASAL